MGLSASKIAERPVEVDHGISSPKLHATKIVQTLDSRDSRLLSLPAEIRVMIYNYVLISNGDIQRLGHAPYPEQPGLLQVNKQVRSEALDIYYKKNTFRWCVHDYDASMYIKWCHSFRHRRYGHNVWHNHGKRQWSNLLRWLQAVYENKAGGPVQARQGHESSRDDRK